MAVLTVFKYTRIQSGKHPDKLPCSFCGSATLKLRDNVYLWGGLAASKVHETGDMQSNRLPDVYNVSQQ